VQDFRAKGTVINTAVLLLLALKVLHKDANFLSQISLTYGWANTTYGVCEEEGNNTS